MRIGIMGGTLDPIHNGHLSSAAFVRDYLKLDSIMLLPAGSPPHKTNVTASGDRVEMARIAAASQECMFACCIEAERKHTTYTYETLIELTEKNPSTQWYYIIGADTLDILDSWKNFGQAAELCIFAVVGRGSEDISAFHMERLTQKYGAELVSVPFNGPDISSTVIRETHARGGDISAMVPEGVAAYIRNKGLYLCEMSFDTIREKLHETLKPGRYTHTIGVAETARHLAERFGVDPQRAYLAGLLHDCAKYMPADEMREMVKGRIDDIDADELESSALMHAPAGAVMAQDVYGVKDAAILSAIRKHTLGGRSMSAMDALIYTADFIEPNREPFKGLDEVRCLAETDIFAAMRAATELTRQYVKKQGKKLHPRMFEILNNY